MTNLIFIVFVLTLVLSLLLTPAAKIIAQKIGAVDLPDHRKVHTQPVTRLGGLSIFISFVLGIILIGFLAPSLLSDIIPESERRFITRPVQYFLIFVSFILVLSIGIWDDVKTLKPGPKFLAQFIAASCLFIAGINISVVDNPLGTGNFALSFLSYPITVLWIIGITNAFNLIDGLDGLAAGIAVIALGTIASIAFIQGEPTITLISVLLASSILGFLWYNFRPASIFLGDSGSLFLGFSLAVLSIEGLTKASTTFTVLVPIFALGLPIIDTILSMVRRFFSWFLPNKKKNNESVSFKQIIHSIFQPDKSHIHHQLISYGFSHKNTVLVLYLVSLLFGISAFAISITGQTSTAVFISLIIAATIKMGISKLRYNEIDLLHNGIFYDIYKSLVINKRHFIKILDSTFIILAFVGSIYFQFPDQLNKIFRDQADTAIILGLPLIIQSITFWLTSLYKETINRLGIADVFKIIKSIFTAITLTSVIHYFFLADLLSFSYLLYILNFYFLVTCILGIRVSFHLLRYLFHKSRTDNRRVLIYGAGTQGLLALQQILALKSEKYSPVGFIDEDPYMEGKLINGFSVFGGHWKLKRLIKTKKIDELHITDATISKEVMRRIYQICLENNLQIKFFDVQLRKLNQFKHFDEKAKNLNYAN
ncbi:MAG: hypothetical protein HUJ22_02515 [Gracilimonas sp.]|uniref:hypothetical protein n=1 Tax=Gracilimonas sp. TaxID=1974203 RepID=UPI001992398B|nr:hypothetical protein [Gracilimonas sp.]MBD3615418.1 hypothetical protein [Gracilimonas sp.]